MDAEQVTEKILADARAEADKIAGEAKEKETAEQASLQEQLQDYNKQTETLAKKAGEDKKAHILAAARMGIAKDYLAEKRSVLDEVFTETHQQLQELSDADYKALCSKLMLEAVETGDEEVIVDNKETRINQEFIKQ
ncbi:MAG: V-type ATP synthase subunit E family protein, partial [Planctomycetota bacterium]